MAVTHQQQPLTNLSVFDGVEDRENADNNNNNNNNNNNLSIGSWKMKGSKSNRSRMNWVSRIDDGFVRDSEKEYERKKMADITMLVAEEYERRMNIARKMVGDEAAGTKFEVGFVSMRGLNKEFNWVSSEFMNVKTAAIRVLEPRTEMGVETLSGSFSA